MKRFRAALGAAVTAAALAPAVSSAQTPAHHRQPYLHVPDSSGERREDVGKVAHTNHAIWVDPEAAGGAPRGETPASLACVYKTIGFQTPGCKIATSNMDPSGGYGVIAIVDAFDYPTAENDLNVFSGQFSLPACTTANGCFRKAFVGARKPRADCGWAQEAALDIEWAHAMAPRATLILVEAQSNSWTDLLAAVDLASSLVTANGGTGQVSMSWGGSEFSTETGFDSHFRSNGVVYFASSGDTGGQRIYPGTSASVVSAGGTSLLRANDGSFVNETSWNGSGGGASRYEFRPQFQDAIASIVGNKRGAPDFSFDADPRTGVSVYDSTVCQGQSGWMVFGGTSVAAPSLAGIVNLAGGRAWNSAQELTKAYSNYLPSASYALYWRDIKTGTAGSFRAGTGWDFVTGLGSPQGLNGK